MSSILKSLIFTAALTLSTFCAVFSATPASAGPLVGTGGIAILLASCEGTNFDVSVVSYDGILKANAHTNGTNILSAVVQSKTPPTIQGLEFVTAPRAHPAFDLVIQTPKGSDGLFTAFLSAELNAGSNSNVITSQPIKCSWAAAPMVNK